MNDDKLHEAVDTKAVESAYESNSIFWVEVEKIVPNPYQPRKEFNEHKLQELAESIRMYGVLQPLVVTRKEITLEHGAFRTQYELIAGERRLRASKMCGLAQVPVIIRSGKESELMKLELAIIENLQREDLNPVDRALAFNQLSAQFGFSATDIGKRLGRSRVYVANSIRLLGLPEKILDAVRGGELSDGHARTLLMLKDRPEEQDVLFREILLKKLTVREVEHLSRQIATEKVRKKSWRDLDPELKEVEKTLSDTLGTKVQIARTDYGGKVVIDYFSAEDLNQILRIMRGESTPLQEQAYTAEREKEVLQTIASATGLEVGEVAEQISRDPEGIDAPNEIERAMEEDLIALQKDDANTEETALEVDDPNDHALLNKTDIPERELATHEPDALVAVETQQDGGNTKGYTDDDLYSLKNFSL